MKRRTFLSAGAVLGMTPVLGMSALNESFNKPTAPKGQQFFEWIRYRLPLGARQSLVADYYRDVAIPALNSAGINNIGVFNVKHGVNDPTLHVIIPHPNLESIVTLNDKLLDDMNFVQAGKNFLNAPLNEMAFVSMEKSILRAFGSIPEIQVPTQKKNNSPRIFQVRTYEAPSLTASKRKIQMFNEGGEIEIFKKTGLQPVLFGETIAGDKMPSLVYIIVFDDFNDMNNSWSKFGADPGWIKLKDEPYYADTVSRINDWIWTPTAFSQI